MSAGYSVRVAWARQHGIDIEAKRTELPRRLVIEAKGEAVLQPQQVNYFLGALGELVQRMDDPNAGYGLALPDNRQYRGLVDRLPTLVWTRLNLMVFFVRRLPNGYEVDAIPQDALESHAATTAEHEGRPLCAACGEPIVLYDPNDPESWIHAPDSNDQADHTAWVD